MKHAVIVFQSPPHGKSSGREGQDLVLAMSSFFDGMSVVFARDGITQLLLEQQPAVILQRNYSKTFKLFNMYDINNVYVVEEDLKELGLKTEDLIIGTKLLFRAELVYLLHGADIKLVY